MFFLIIQKLIQSVMAITDPSIENSDVAKRQRKLVKTCLQFFETSDAVYWADKLVSLTSYHLEDVYLLCRSLFADKQYKRCAVLIKDNSLEAEIPAFRLLAARWVLLMRTLIVQTRNEKEQGFK